MRIIFESGLLSHNGTCVAVTDYAKYNQEILGNESIILVKTNEFFHRINPRMNHNEKTIETLKKDYKILFYNSWEEAEKILSDYKADLFYAIKSGSVDEMLSKNTKTAVHAVFRHLTPHGQVNAFISEWLSKNFLGGEIPFVPHMVNLPDVNDDMRSELGIPKDSIVVGRYGSRTTFNIPFVYDVINNIINERKDIYFLFMNTDNVCEFHSNKILPPQERIIFLPPTFDPIEKSRFINTCDIMLHARTNGESFGLAIAEFSSKNKPVITWTGKNHHLYYQHGHDLAHVDMLGDKGIYYDDYETLFYILKHLTIDRTINWDAYTEKFNPKNVMEKFKNVFID